MNAKPTLSLVSLGCAKNAVDLQVRAGKMLKAGYRFSEDPDRAEVIIVNTCAFIASAREEAEAEIARALELKRRGMVKRVIVTGCYPERYPKRHFEGVDEWIGVPKAWEEPQVPALRFTGKAFAYLKIAEGCAHRCAYCAIPAIRGKYRSRPLAAILKEARELLKTGCKELNIVAQDPMLWREGDKTLTDLLWALDKLKGEFWIRVLYSYPSEITEDFVIWMMTAKHAVKYIDVPLQHTVPAVLEKMNRKPAIEASLSAAEALREIMPEITLRTTIMTGFPGETELRFKQLMGDLKRMQFDHLGAFAYSPEEGTKGAKMKSRPSSIVAEERRRLVMEQQAEIWACLAKRMLKRRYRALVVAPGVARMESQAPEVDGVVYLESEKGKVKCEEVGTFIEVELKCVKGFDFVGKVVRK